MAVPYRGSVIARSRQHKQGNDVVSSPDLACKTSVDKHDVLGHCKAPDQSAAEQGKEAHLILCSIQQSCKADT